jgi:3-hydroxyisobutyrate dehydrogenase-like beta-hydroxyacid dehydrogenase
MANLGYIGLGVMGGRVAKRLLAAGHSVIGYDLVKSKGDELIKAGMKWANSPCEVASRADITFSMVTNTNAVLALTGGPDGVLEGLTPGKIYIDMSTVSPAVSRDIAKQVAAKGAFMLDSPVSGSVETLEAGKLTLMVAGDEAIFEKVKSILLDIGPKATYVGANGLAVTMKIATNLSLGAQMLAFCEALLLAEKSGIKREVAAEVLLNSVIASPMLKYRGPFVMKMPDEAWFNVNMMQKDLNLALELGRQVDVPLPTTAATNELLTAARGMGYVEQDYAVIFKVLARMSGLNE